MATKGGFIPFDGAVPRDPRAYFATTYVETGIVKPGDVTRGAHCMTPRYLRDQIDRSRANLGLETLDVYYLHNPETQLAEVERAEFLRRIRAAFEALEEAVADGTHRALRHRDVDRLSRRSGRRATTCRSPSSSPAARDVGGADHHFKVDPAALQPRHDRGLHARQPAREGPNGPACSRPPGELGVYVMASASVHQGQLTRKLPPMMAEYIPGLTTDAQRALQFVRSTPGIGTALVGMKSRRPRRGEREGRRDRRRWVGAVPAPLQRRRRLAGESPTAWRRPATACGGTRAGTDRKTLRRATGSGRVMP